MPLILITVGLTLILKYVVTPRYGDDVRAPFLERFNYIPSRCSALTQGTLAGWLDDKSNEEAKAGYSFPVLFPLDFIFLLCLGFLLGLASIALADRLSFLSNVPAWVWWHLIM